MGCVVQCLWVTAESFFWLDVWLHKIRSMYPIYNLLHKWKWSREKEHKLWLIMIDSSWWQTEIMTQWLLLFSHLSFLQRVCNTNLQSSHLQLQRLHFHLHLLQWLLVSLLRVFSSFSFYPSLLWALKMFLAKSENRTFQFYLYIYKCIAERMIRSDHNLL